MTKFILIRHATNDAVGKRLVGRMEGVQLNEEGKQQAQLLAERLSASRIAAIYSSPLERAVDTATPIAASLQLEIMIEEDLTDLEFGDWTNRTIEDLKDNLQFQRFNSFRSSTRIPGGESMLEAQTRMITTLEKLRTQHRNTTVAVISHADIIKSAIAYYAGIHLDMLLRIEVDPVSVSIIEVTDDTASILLVNHTGELRI
jgi:probable phosphoglycerate mutase